MSLRPRISTSSATSSSPLARCVRDPVVGFVDRVAAPSVEGVVQSEARLELLMIVRMEARETERGGKQPGRLRRQLGPRGVGAAYDRGEPGERFDAAQAELREHGVEGALIAAVAPEHAFR